MKTPTLSLSVIYILLALILSSIQLNAQNYPILAVNKTGCDLIVKACCTNDFLNCDYQCSEEITIPPHSTHLFDDSNPPESGCDGNLAFLKFVFPPLPSPSYHIAFPTTAGIPCNGIQACIDLPFVEVAYTYNEIPSNCLGENGGVRGQYHANPSGGSHCHIVFEYAQYKALS